jgi:hypothetical protein
VGVLVEGEPGEVGAVGVGRVDVDVPAFPVRGFVERIDIERDAGPIG